jgi:hypothetical protein
MCSCSRARLSHALWLLLLAPVPVQMHPRTSVSPLTSCAVQCVPARQPHSNSWHLPRGMQARDRRALVCGVVRGQGGVTLGGYWRSRHR